MMLGKAYRVKMPRDNKGNWWGRREDWIIAGTNKRRRESFWKCLKEMGLANPPGVRSSDRRIIND